VTTKGVFKSAIDIAAVIGCPKVTNGDFFDIEADFRFPCRFFHSPTVDILGIFPTT
jgi:hypothetical protein